MNAIESKNANLGCIEEYVLSSSEENNESATREKCEEIRQQIVPILIKLYEAISQIEVTQEKEILIEPKILENRYEELEKYDELISRIFQFYLKIIVKPNYQKFGWSQSLHRRPGYFVSQYRQILRVYKVKMQNQALCQAFHQFFKEGRFLDFQIVCGSEIIKINRAFISARSPYFNALFNNLMRESSSDKLVFENQDLVDMNTDFFYVKQVIEFLYQDQMNFDEKSIDSIKKLIGAAEFFQVTDLTDACAFELVKRLDENTYETILSIAHEYQLNRLIQACHLIYP